MATWGTEATIVESVRGMCEGDAGEDIQASPILNMDLPQIGGWCVLSQVLSRATALQWREIIMGDQNRRLTVGW